MSMFKFVSVQCRVRNVGQSWKLGRVVILSSVSHCYPSLDSDYLNQQRSAFCFLWLSNYSKCYVRVFVKSLLRF